MVAVPFAGCAQRESAAAKAAADGRGPRGGKHGKHEIASPQLQQLPPVGFIA